MKLLTYLLTYLYKDAVSVMGVANVAGVGGQEVQLHPGG